MLSIIVFFASSTAIAAKQVFNKYLPNERRNVLRIRKYRLTHLFGKFLKCIPNNLEMQPVEKLMNATSKGRMQGLVGN